MPLPFEHGSLIMTKLKDHGWGVLCVTSIVVYATLAILFIINMAAN
jgi:hypothetical protein